MPKSPKRKSKPQPQTKASDGPPPGWRPRPPFSKQDRIWMQQALVRQHGPGILRKARQQAEREMAQIQREIEDPYGVELEEDL